MPLEDDPREQPTFRALDQPRPLSAGERGLLLGLASAIGADAVMTQADDAVVIGECTCGCSSVQLSTSAAPLPADLIAWFSATGRTDYLSVNWIAQNPDGHHVSLVLHMVRGRLHELEVFDATAGEGAPVDLAALTRYGNPEIV